MRESAPKIEMVSTGNELLDGTISDTNTQTLALALKPLGLKISRTSVVPDERSSIAQAVVEAAARSDLVFISGGLGPTTDDMTLEVAAHALGKKMIFSSEAKRNVVVRLKRFKRRMMNPSQLKQFYIPEGAEVLENIEGTAPGIKMKVGRTTLYFLPGVPREFRHILDKEILPEIKELSAPLGEYLFVVKIFGRPESELNELMQKISIPSQVTIGYRTHLPENHIKIQVSAKSFSAASLIAKKIIQQIELKLASNGFLWQDSSFEEVILASLLKMKARVAIAESCTGGLVCSMLTKISGSSQAIDRGFVTYSNQAKMDLLGVKSETLEKHGAVSKEVAIEMVKGALSRSLATRAISVTGIAGPTGGTPQKPVGTIWIAAATGKKIKTRCLHLGLNRELNQKYSAYEALRMLTEI
ncbi:MAG: CinA-like protein [Bacteriovoracaceae bacterium]|nr:CinA-like protein [Bacteriovoracaceae bacterium]